MGKEMNVWRLIEPGLCAGETNMRRDVRLAESPELGDGIPVLTLYGWNPPAISLGYHQDISAIDEQAARRAGIDIVRRPTGGRAILHWNEVTYSVVTRIEPASAPTWYRHIGEAIVNGLRTLGIVAELERASPNLSEHYATIGGVVCFSSTARNEIKAEGKKLVGSAQRQFHRPDGTTILLQHGSILIGDEHKRIVELLNGRSASQRTLLKAQLNTMTISIDNIIHGKATYTDVANAVRKGFETYFEIQWLRPEGITTGLNTRMNRAITSEVSV